jgi:hypothetical protein
MVAQAEARYTELFWSSVAERYGMKPPGSLPSTADDADVEALSRSIALSEERLDALQRVDADFAKIDAEWRRPSDDVPPCLASTTLDIQGAIARTCVKDTNLQTFERIMMSFGPRVHVERVSEQASAAFAMIGDVPFQVLCEISLSQQSGQPLVDMTTQTTVPRLFGELELAPQGFGSELLIALRLKRDIKINDAEFDGSFVIGGDVDAARAMLNEKVRKVLLAIARLDIPRLTVGHGLATLTWHYEPTRAILDTAFQALSEIRRASPTRSLRVSKES